METEKVVWEKQSTTTLYVDREIHPRVKDLQRSHWLQIFDTWGGFPCPCTKS